MMTPTGRAVVACVSVILGMAGLAPGSPGDTGIVQMTRILQDPKRCEQAMAALGVIADKELAPLFAGASASQAAGSAPQRLVAMSALARLGPDEAKAPLLNRFRSDPDAMIQGKALALLLNLQAVEPEDIRMGLRTEDVHVQCLAARALVARGSGYMAVTTLRDLVAAEDMPAPRPPSKKDPAPRKTEPAPKKPQVPIGVKAMARLSLLATGDTSQMQPLLGLIRDKRQPTELRELLAAQITRDKITVALPLALELVKLADEDEARLLAYEAVSTASPNDASELTLAIRNATSPIYQIRLLELLAVRPDAKTHLQALADRPGLLGLLVRFELARSAALNEAAGEAAMLAVSTEQPIAVAYVLSRARRDVDEARKDSRDQGAKAACYVPALARCIQAASPDSPALGADHHRAGRAAAMLVDIGTREALAHVKAVLEGKYDNRVRAVAAGVMEAKNPAVGDLARPLLASPYPEIAWRGGMILGMLGDRSARTYLNRIVTTPDDYPDEKVILAAWFLVKMENLAKSTAVQMGQMLKTSAK